MKRFLALIISVVMVLCICTSCDNPYYDKDKQGSQAVAQIIGAAEGVEGKTIGLCIYKYDDNFMSAYREELDKYLRAGGARVEMMDGKNDQAEQTNQIMNFIAQKVDLLIINLVQSTSAQQITDLCHNANIPVIYINREPSQDEQQRWVDNHIAAAYVGNDARQSGQMQGEIILALPNKGDVNGDGKVSYVMVMGDPENIDTQYRTEKSIETLTNAGVKVEKIDQQRADWDQAKGEEVVANSLTAHGTDIEVVFSNSDSMALGALQAIQANGRTVGKDIYLVGVDGLVEALEDVKKGELTGTVFNDYDAQTKKLGQVLTAMMAGQEVPTRNMADYVRVTSDNIDSTLELVRTLSSG